MMLYRVVRFEIFSIILFQDPGNGDEGGDVQERKMHEDGDLQEEEMHEDGDVQEEEMRREGAVQEEDVNNWQDLALLVADEINSEHLIGLNGFLMFLKTVFLFIVLTEILSLCFGELQF